MIMQDNEKKPALRFKGFTDPWEQRKLDEAFDFTVPNNTFSRAELNQESGTVQNVHYGDILIKYGSVLDVQSDELPFITGRSKEDFRGALLQDGDIIIADTAEDETTGKVCEIVNIQDKDVVAGLHTMVCRPRNKTAEGYFGYYLNSNSYHHQLLPLMQGIKVLSLSRANVQKTTVKYPKDKAEQQKIADCLRSIDTLITLHQRKYEKLVNIKKSMLDKMFPKNGASVPEIRFKGFTDPWEQRKLEEYLEVSGQKNFDGIYSKEDVLSVSGDFGIVNQIEFQGRSFAGASVANYGVVETGDIVYTKSPLKSNPYGIIKANKGKNGIVSTLYAVYKPKQSANPEFVQIYFEQDARMNNYMHPLVNKGAKNDMKVSAENALKGQIVFPDIEEQRTISEFFRNLDTLITLHQREHIKPILEVKRVKRNE